MITTTLALTKLLAYPGIQMSQRVMITAGASGIGLAIAKAFAGSGAKVHLCDVDQRALTDAATIYSTTDGTTPSCTTGATDTSFALAPNTTVSAADLNSAVARDYQYWRGVVKELDIKPV